MSRDRYKDVPVWRRPQRTSWVVTTSIVLLLVCCLFLLVRAYWLDLRLREAEERVEHLQEMVTDQQVQLQRLLRNGVVMTEPDTVDNKGEKGDVEGEVGVSNEDSSSTAALETSAEAVTSKTEEIQNVGEEIGALNESSLDVNDSDSEAASEDANTQEMSADHKVYLTFDDGPSIYTDNILDILARYDVKATFFVVGKEESFNDEMLCRIVEEGHTLGLHSYSHKYAEIYKSVEAFETDFKKLQDEVYEVTGHRSYVYRFPGGSSNQVSQVDMMEFVEYLDTQNVEYYDWNISAGDGASTLLDVDTIVSNCTRNITQRGTTIVLMHDSADKSTTLEALPRIIETIQAMEGTAILPITENTEPMHHLET